MFYCLSGNIFKLNLIEFSQLFLPCVNPKADNYAYFVTKQMENVFPYSEKTDLFSP